MISIIIPTFNRGYIIEKSIKSVLKQDYKSIEIIVVDDGSTDNTHEVIQKMKSNKIKYIKLNKNQGANRARNEGIFRAKGEYIAFQDSDDIWEEDKLSKQLTAIKNSKADIVFCGMTVKYFNKKKTKLVPGKDLKEGFINYEKLLKGSIASTQTLLIKKECFELIKFDPKIPRLQDWDLILRLSKDFSVYFLNERLVSVYQQENSISNDAEKGRDAVLMIMNKHLPSIEKNKLTKAYFYEILAMYSFKDRKNSNFYYKKSLNLELNIKVMLKFILYNIKLYPLG